jgi:hypothetical protein
MKTICIILLLVIASVAVVATPAQPASASWTADSVVDSLTKAIAAQYFFTDRIAGITAAYQQNKANGEYRSITDPNQLADKLTADFQAANRDLHFQVMYNPQVENNIAKNNAESDKESCGFVDPDADRQNNYGFKKVEILPGNIGYIRFDMFSTSYNAFQTAISSLDFVSNTDALIIDLRNNVGGSAYLVQFISTYLYDEHYSPVLLSSGEMRQSTIPLQSWTLPYVPGKRFPDIPIYVLTSKNTGSAAEAFAFSFKAIQRGKIVGETTAGAAHPVAFVKLGKGFVAMIPIGKISNPLTKTDWEGVGVTPDITVDSKIALDHAYKMILDSLTVKTTDPGSRFKLNWAMDAVNSKLTPIELKAKDLPQFAGQYGQRTISIINNRLYYKRFAKEALMLPLGVDKFMVEGMDNFRIRFERDAKGNVINLIGMYEDGREDTSARTKS